MEDDEENDMLPLLAQEDIEDGDSDSSDGMSANEEENENDNIDERIEEYNSNSNKHTKPPDKEKKTITFDSSLPSTHSYLGNNLEEVRGRTIHDEDAYLTLPILQLPGVVLVPGQTIPLHLFNQHTVAMLKGVLDRDKTFGVVTYKHSDHLDRVSVATTGTTAEIFSVHDDTDDLTGISTIKIKAKGRQRFQIIDTERSTTGVLIGKVKILPEIVLTENLDAARPPSHCKFCCCPTKQDSVVHTAVDRQGNVIKSVAMINNRQINKFTAAHYTWWPPWVYKMYDAELLTQRTKDALHKWNETLTPDRMPNDPIELSYWVIQNLPLDDNMRLYLLCIDNAVQRLRCALSIIEKCSVLRCKDCDEHIADKEDVFCLSYEGPLGAYVNPGGYVHETFTVYKTHNLNLTGRPSTEHSWFPGYAWTIANCKRCSSHMGWRFTATSKKLKPQKFFGLTRASVVPGLQSVEGDEDEWMPVM